MFGRLGREGGTAEGRRRRGVRIGEGRGRRGEGGGERHNLVVLVRAGIGGTASG